MKVSVIVPVYNTEKYLKQCIDSITAQTLNEIEIIIVDDGSKKECALLCDEIAQKDSRIKVIHKENAGAGMARNTGIEAACGEYIGFVDSDDYIDPKMYETLYEAAARNGADIAISGVAFVGGNTFGKSGEYVEKPYFDKETIFEEDGIKDLLLGVVGALPSETDDSRYGVSVCKNIFRRELFFEKSIRFESERKVMSEDALIMVDYIKSSKKAVGIPGAFYCYRRNDASFSKSYKEDRFDNVLIFLSELENRIKDTVQKDEYKIYLDRLTQGYGRIVCSQEIMYAVEKKIGYSKLRKRLENICTHEAILSYLWFYSAKGPFAF